MKQSGFYIAILFIVTVVVVMIACAEPSQPPSSKTTPSSKSVPQYNLRTSIDPKDAGAITLTERSYSAGDKVTLVATPAPGYIFDYWSGDVTDKSTSITIIIEGDKTITAHFKAQVKDSILFQDDFSSNKNNWYISDKAYIKDGTFHMLILGPQNYSGSLTFNQWPLGAKDSPNCGLKVDITPIQADSENGRGLAFLCNQNTNYAFLISMSGEYLLARKEGNVITNTIPWTKSPHIRQGQDTNEIKVICRNSIIELYANEQLLETVKGKFPSNIDKNGFGLVVDGKAGTHIAFDNLKMWTVAP